jgi:cobalt/nickel transport system ATP-binding protein
MPTPILETHHLTYAYSKRSLALDDVSISIPAGKKVAVLGANGSGKSTLFLHFNGVLRPKQGEVVYDGRPIEYGAKALAKLREEVSVVMQNPDDQIFSATVEEDVAFGPLNLDLTRDDVQRRVDEALFLVDMEKLRERPTQQLSFGQRKRVALAGALAMKPQVLMMDEPTAGLDSRMVHELMELAEELNRNGLTVIMSTHDVEIAYNWADQVCALGSGRLLFSGPPEKFFSDDRMVRDLGLATPLLFDLNQRLNVLRGIAVQPYPRTLEEMMQKFFPRIGPSGRLSLVAVGADFRTLSLAATGPAREPVGAKVGVYGTLARRFAREGHLQVDHIFNALERGIGEASQGKDFILYVDEPLIPLVEERIADLAHDFGLSIPVFRAQDRAVDAPGR